MHLFMEANVQVFCLVVMLDQNGFDFEAEAAEIVFAIKGFGAGEPSEERFTH